MTFRVDVRLGRVSIAACALLGAPLGLVPALGIAAYGQSAVSVAPLADVDPLAVGVLTRAEGAFDSGLWRGTDVVLAQQAIESAPSLGAPASAASLAARVLQSGGSGPSGEGDRASVAIARVERLAELGYVDAVAELVAVTPALRADSGAATLGVRAMLARDDLAQACALAEGFNEEAAGPFWIRMRVACFAFAGEATAAELTLDLAREKKVAGVDASFTEWVVNAAGAAGAAPRKTPRDSIELALARANDSRLSADALEGLDALDTAAVAFDEGAEPVARVTAAQRLAGSGAVSPVEYGAIMRAAAGAPEHPSADLLAKASEAEGVARDMLLHQAVAAADTPTSKAAAIAAALKAARGAAAFQSAALLYASDLVFLEVNSETLPHAETFVAAAAAAGDTRSAHTWLRARLFASGAASPPPAIEPITIVPTSMSAEVGAVADPFAADPPVLSSLPALEPAAEAQLRALVTLADASSSERALAEAALGLLDAGSSEFHDQAAAILLALGAASTPELRQAATRAGEAASTPSDARVRASAAQRASEARAGAETALFAAAAVASAYAGASPDMDAVGQALSALVRADLGAEARALAVGLLLDATQA